MALVLIASALFASVASANTKTPPLKPTAYVAIGDSISFGYTEEKFDLNYPAESPSAFEHGFTNVVAAKLAKAEKAAGNGLNLVNLGCPGETSDGVIGHALGNTEEEYDPCAYHNLDGFPLHVEFGGASELEAAIGAVSNPVVPVKAVTINIGSNDELASVHECENPTYLAENGYTGGLDECLVNEVGPGSHRYPGYGVFGHIITNVGTVIGVLRAYGYTGPIAILGFYNPQAELLPGSDALQKGFNETFEGYVAASAFGPGVTFANPFPLVNPQNKNEASHICKYTEECNAFDKKVGLEELVGHPVTATEAEGYPVGDIHPTPLGYEKIGKLVYAAL
jgi:lysophospholipase L1-like esterase